MVHEARGLLARGSVVKLAATAVLLSLVACGASVPKELVDARVAYARASHGPAAELDASDVHVAKRELAEAESSFARLGDIAATRDLAYVAKRRAEIAEARAGAVAARGALRDARSRLDRLDADRVELTSATLRPIAAFPLPRFERNDVSLSPETQAVLDRVARALARDPRASAVVELPEGGAAMDRGASIRAQLAARGIATERITTRSTIAAPRILVQSPSP